MTLRVTSPIRTVLVLINIGTKADGSSPFNLFLIRVLAGVAAAAKRHQRG